MRSAVLRRPKALTPDEPTLTLDHIKRVYAEFHKRYGRQVMGDGDSLLWFSQMLIDDLAASAHPVAPAEPSSPLSLAVIGRRHFGNPIPREWYAAAQDLLADVARATPPASAAQGAEPVQVDADLREVEAFVRANRDSGLRYTGLRAIERIRAALTQRPAPAPEHVKAEAGRYVFLVATGEQHEGEETYTRHDDAPPPMCDFEGPLVLAFSSSTHSRPSDADVRDAGAVAALLRAMAANYANGHEWDKLDGDLVLRAASLLERAATPPAAQGKPEAGGM